jgi:hypothetical protein
MYHLPHLVKIKTVNLPIKYLNNETKMTVSSQSNIQIYTKSIVYFLYIEGKFEEIGSEGKIVKKNKMKS